VIEDEDIKLESPLSPAAKYIKGDEKPTMTFSELDAVGPTDGIVVRRRSSLVDKLLLRKVHIDVPEDDCKDAFDDGKDEFRTQYVAAIKGSGSAKYLLGKMYMYGYYGITMNTEKAFFWLSEAVLSGEGKGDPSRTLGFLYMTGHQGRVKADYEKALEAFNAAVEAGCSEANFNAGLMHWTGKGTEANSKEAFLLFEKSSDSRKAQNNLGVMYALGDGVKADNKKALKWFKKSADGGCKEAEHNLGMLYLTGKGVTRDTKKADEYFKISQETSFDSFASPVAKDRHKDAMDNAEFLTCTDHFSF